MTALIGAVPAFRFGHDEFLPLENGWRTLYGQRPHIDYWSAFGPVSFLFAALGLLIGHDSPNALGYTNAIIALMLGLWVYRIGRDRLAPAPNVLLALYAAILVSAPYPLGTWPMQTSDAMAYNRFGYALLIPVLLESFQSGPRERNLWGGISTGVAAGLALFLKASFFLVAAGLIAASLVLWRPNLRRLLGLATGFGAIALALGAYLSFRFPLVFHALEGAAKARSKALSPKTPFYTLEAHLPPLLSILALAIAATFLKPRLASWLGDLYWPAVAIVVYLADIALLSTNAQPAALPLIPALAVLIAASLTDRELAPPDGLLLLLLAGLLVVPQMGADMIGLAAGARWKMRPPPVCATRFTEPRLSALILCDRPDESQKSANGSTYTAYVNDGTAMLRQHATSSDRVLTMDMQNPFPYAMGWAPPRGGMSSMTFNYTVSASAGPTFDEYFGDATVVMLPKHPAQTPLFADGFYALYVPALERRFHLAAESDWWKLYKRGSFTSDEGR